LEVPPPLISGTPPKLEEARAIALEVQRAGRRQLNKAEAARLLACFGIPYARTEIGRSAEQVLAIATDIRSSSSFCPATSNTCGREVATILMGRLFEAAHDGGYSRMTGCVLPENDSMLRLAARLGFTRSKDEDDPALVTVVRALL
ncbi:MAG: hypothetical protein ABIO19_02710, partial [Burkholderiaceae bacterium]